VPETNSNVSQTSSSTAGETPNAQSLYHVSRSDLPLHCPTSNMSLWNSHPRVFLPIEETGKARCPYCGTEFILND